MSNFDFPCSRSFRQFEAAQEGLDLPPVDTRSDWERDWDTRFPYDALGYSLSFLAMQQKVTATQIASPSPTKRLIPPPPAIPTSKANPSTPLPPHDGPKLLKLPPITKAGL